MLTIYHSNQLELLKILAAELIKRQSLDSVFAPEMFLVQSNGMAQWLQMQLAEELNIAANMSFIAPSQFIWQMYHLVLNDVPEKNYFDKDTISWKLMQLLPQLIHSPEFSQLTHYLEGEEKQRKYYQLATRIADLYDQYLVYRPQWIEQWEKGQLIDPTDNHEQWQAALWRQLIDYTAALGQSTSHRANIYQRFITTLSQQKTLPTKLQLKLPQRLFIFGIASLPPVYLASLSALGKHIDIHLMFTNPCRWYWGDIPDERWLNQLLQTKWSHYQNKNKRVLLKNQTEQFDFFQPIQPSNPLLASWGKLGRDNLFLLQNHIDKQDIEAFVDLTNDSLLHALQQQILDLEDKTVIGEDERSFSSSKAKQVISKHDFSISFHSCHSELREVEVLYDYLLAMLDSEQELLPRDIVVMVADIDRYAPYINAVFTNPPSHRYLPFTVSDRKIRYIDPIMQAFFSLLNLTQSRFTAEAIFDLLEVPALAAKFAIDETQIKQLRKWCVEAGIRWGLDDEMIAELSLPVQGMHTWQFGLTRMLLGYVMNGEQGAWNDIMPFEASHGLAAELVGKLADLLFYLVKWRKKLNQNLKLNEWRSICYAMMEDFFQRDQQSEPLLMVIEQAWNTLIDRGIEAGHEHPITIVVLYEALQTQLENTRIEQRFLSGKINFCTMLPMRSIPFKVVCLLGMNDGVYPRTTLPIIFDLINKKPQKGDRSRRDDDRYLFLEAILSAQQQLYISYIGHAMSDNSPRFPSVLVDELRDYLAQSFVIRGDQKQDIDTSAARLKSHLTINHARMPFKPDNYRANKQQYYIKSYADEWLAAAQMKGQSKPFNTGLATILTKPILIEELKQFYRHPVKTILQKRLNIYFTIRDDELPDVERFDLDNLARYQINQLLLEQFIKDDTEVHQLVTKIKAQGLLPYGAFGELWIERQLQDMQQLAQKVIVEKMESSRVEVNLYCAQQSLQGWLNQIQSDGILRWHAGKLSVYDGMALWIEHLILTLVKQNGEHQSRMYGRDNTVWRFQPLSVTQAQSELENLVNGYIQGMNHPLILPLKSAWSWLESCVDKENQTILTDNQTQAKARQKLQASWEGNNKFLIPRECDDYYLRLIPTLNNEIIEQIEALAIRFLLPMFKARIS